MEALAIAIKMALGLTPRLPLGVHGDRLSLRKDKLMRESAIRARRNVIWGIVVTLFLFTIACDDIESLLGSQKPPAVSIVQPLNGTQVDAGQQLDIVAMGTHSKGITHIEFWVDGALDGSQLNPLPNTSPSFSAQHTWSAGTPGQHILLARAYDSKGRASPDATVLITVREGQPTPTTEAEGAWVVATPTLPPNQTPAPPGVVTQLPLPPPTQQIVIPQPPLPPPPTTSVMVRPPNCGLITDFDDVGSWKRGDEPFGTFTQTGERVHSGSFSGKLTYNFPTGGNDYVVFLKTYPMGGHGSQIHAQVYGDGSGHFLNGWIKDAGGEVWQFTFGQVKHTGWKQMTAYLGVPQSWPSGHVSGPANGIVEYPIDFHALVLDDAPDTYAGSGVIYVDELYCAEGPNMPPPTPTDIPPPTPTQPAPPPPPPPSGPPSIDFSANKEFLPHGECTELHWAVENVREVYLDGDGVAGHGEKEVCPDADTTYTLHVVKTDGSTEDEQITISVIFPL